MPGVLYNLPKTVLQVQNATKSGQVNNFQGLSRGLIKRFFKLGTVQWQINVGPVEWIYNKINSKGLIEGEDTFL